VGRRRICSSSLRSVRSLDHCGLNATDRVKGTTADPSPERRAQDDILGTFFSKLLRFPPPVLAAIFGNPLLPGCGGDRKMLRVANLNAHDGLCNGAPA